MKRLEVKVAMFILGFTFIYVILGISFALVGSYLNMSWFFSFAGVILIIFGLHVMHVFRIRWLEAQLGGMNRAKEAEDIVGSFLVGIAFAIGWSPCTGPIVAAILGLAAQQKSVFAGGFLLLCYCVGLGIPFMLIGLAVGKFLRLFDKVKKHMRKVEIASGILLIILGALFLSQNVNFLREISSGKLGFSTEGLESLLAPEVGQGVSLFAVGAAFLAGLLSFISPCVLPLLPSYIAFIAGADNLDALYADDKDKAAK